MGRRLLGFGLAALVIGLVPALLVSDDRRLPVRLWLIASVVWLTWSLVTTLLRQLPPAPASVRLPWRRRRGNRVDDIDDRPNSLHAVQGTILASRDSGRAYALRLRPRLVALADHQLALHHGIDRTSEPARVEAVLGDVAWLITDRTETGRPTLAEIDRLLDILAVPHPDASEARTP
ncbi:MAG: hypothetical protein AAFN30_01210 [Actinomycetota bacterium]